MGSCPDTDINPKSFYNEQPFRSKVPTYAIKEQIFDMV